MVRVSFLVIINSIIFSVLALAQPTLGLLQHNEEQVSDGYILFTNSRETYLIDNCGLIVNQWTSEYRPALNAYLYPNGNLLRAGELDGTFVQSGHGGHFELFNWEGELLWSWELNTSNKQLHHSFTILPNGHFLCLAWERISVDNATELGVEDGQERWSESIYEVDPTAEEPIVWEWHAKDHLIQNRFPTKVNYGQLELNPEKIDINYRPAGATNSPNWIHLNAIDYHAGNQQILVSSRMFSEVWVIDHSTTTTEAASSNGGRYGKGGDLLYRFGNPSAWNRPEEQQLFAQHDAQWMSLANGGMAVSVFNNQFSADQSAVTTWELPLLADGTYETAVPSWVNPKNLNHQTGMAPLYSEFMSSAQGLTNGHTFLCSGMEGRFVEWDKEGNTVWEYLNPVNSEGGPAAQGATPRLNQTFKATKYAPNFTGFLGRTLVGIKPVELNPDSSDCFVPAITSEFPVTDVIISPNPASQWVDLQSVATQELPYQCYSINGQLLREGTLPPLQTTRFFITDWPQGLYVLWLYQPNGKVLARRWVKNSF